MLICVYIIGVHYVHSNSSYGFVHASGFASAAADFGCAGAVFDRAVGCAVHRNFTGLIMALIGFLVFSIVIMSIFLFASMGDE